MCIEECVPVGGSARAGKRQFKKIDWKVKEMFSDKIHWPTVSQKLI